MRLRFLALIFLFAPVFLAHATESDTNKPVMKKVSEPAKVQQLSEHVFIINLQHYTSLVVVGSEDVLITDTANADRARLLRDEIAKLTDKPISKIVLSHEHFDHVDGTEVFPLAEIIAHQNIKSYRGLDPLGMLPSVIHTTFSERLTIDMDTTTIELRSTSVADGIAIALVYLPKEKIALTADLYGDEGLSPGVYLSDINLLGSRKILNELVKMDLNHAINVHSNRTDMASLIATAGFLNDLYEAVLSPIKEAAKNKSPSDLVSHILHLSETLELPKYRDWPNYSDLPIYVRKMGFAIVHGG